MESSLMPRSIRSGALVTVLALATLPSLATGQMPVRRDNNPLAGKPAPIVPVNVARAVIEHERDMALSDSQRTQIVVIQRRLDSTTAPMLKKLDSLRPTFAKAREQVMSVLRPEQRERAAKFERDARKRAQERAKRELESRETMEAGSGRRRGQIRDATGRAPLG